MPLGREVGLGPSNIALDGTQLRLPKKGHSPPIFSPFLLWPNGQCIRIRLGMEVGLILGDIVLDGDPAAPA